MPIRYFVLNAKTNTMHIYGYCQHTKVRSIPIRLFDTPEELEAYAGRKLTLCKDCQNERMKRACCKIHKIDNRIRKGD